MCPNCKSKNSVKKTISRGKIITGCDACLPQLQQGGDAAFDRRWQQTQYRRELTQPNQGRDFIKAYPDKAPEYMNEETIRKLS